ncbi:MAG: indole-3-glycerol phosphate synthase TrpC [Thermodesulfobacteriota bacterium]|nr:indole-3-glycerol phosphate synthase TrpC [Thermodesulfobacteriota bacterium]
MILKEIIKDKREEVTRLFRDFNIRQAEKDIKGLPPARRFKSALSRFSTNIIAEIKKASPSKGMLRENLEVTEVARLYEKEGACAISVLTEKKYFKGNIDYLTQVNKSTELPVLCKDFIIDFRQIYLARLKGADAILLITAILEFPQYKDFLGLAKELGLYVLSEIHDQKELFMILKTNPEIIGINNRDLNTFETDITTTIDLIKFIPEDSIVVSESGIKNRQNIEKLKEAGVNAFLIGEAIIGAESIENKFRELLGRYI